MADKIKHKALGRGLSALLPSKSPAPKKETKIEKTKESKSPKKTDENLGLVSLPITSVYPSKNQPRKAVDEEALEELTESIRSKGILSPIIVRAGEDNNYLIIAGERRWRAARRAGLTQIPVFLKETDELEAFELALIENIQREDLSPLEEADSYFFLMNSRGYAQDAVAGKVGKKRSTIANALRLLRLPQEVKDLLDTNKISTGHARALLGLSNETQMVETALIVVAQGLSVRDVEKLVRNESKRPAPRRRRTKNQQLRALEDQLRNSLGTKVNLSELRKGKGIVAIDYYSLEQLDSIINLLIPEADDEHGNT
jgi:ParB family transcriptional regulator, chromosome partitioning protein